MRRLAARATAAVALLAALAAGMTAPDTAAAVDLTVGGFLSQRFDATTGDGGGRSGGSGGGSDDGGRARSLTSLGLTILAQTPRAVLRLAPGVTGALSTASEAEPEVNFRLNAAGTYRAPRFDLTASASIVPDFVEEAQFEDTGRVERASLLQITASTRLGGTFRLDPAHSLALGLTARQRSFSEQTDTLAETRSFGADIGVRRTATSATSLSLGAGARLFESEAVGDPTSRTVNATLGIDHKVNPRLTVTASLGPAVTLSDREGRDEETNFGVVGSVNASYRLARLRVGVGLTQDVDQSSDGETENQSRLRGDVSYELSPVSRIGFNVSVGLQTAVGSEDGESSGGGSGGGGDGRRTFSFAPRYSYDLTEDWGVSGGYRFRVSDDDDVELSNLVFIEISRGLSFLP